MRALNSHPYAADCVCPTCADHRVDRKLGVINDFINWANAPLRAGMRRFIESRPEVKGVNVSRTVLRDAGLPLPHLAASITTLNLQGHARA